MRFTESLADIAVRSNMSVTMRERGKLVDRREGHNVFTITGRNLLSKLLSWQTPLTTNDVPYTQRRVRWMGVGIGTQLEVTNVSSLNQATLATATDYLVPIQSVEFPTSTSVRFIREFATGEITVLSPTPVVVTEAGLFADVDLASGPPTEDAPFSGGRTTLDPSVTTNPPIAYKAFDGMTKTRDFTMEIHWELRFL